MKKLIIGLFILINIAPAYALTGKEIYNQTCVACHGPNGKGVIPGAANFTDPNGPIKKSDSDLLKHVIEGFQSPGSPMAMPPRAGNPSLTDADLKNTLKYIRETFAPKK